MRQKPILWSSSTYLYVSKCFIKGIFYYQGKKKRELLASFENENKNPPKQALWNASMYSAKTECKHTDDNEG